MLIPLGMAEWYVPFLVTLTLTLTSGLISRFIVGPQRSTEMAMTTQQTQKSNDLNVSDAQSVKGFIRYQTETR